LRHQQSEDEQQVAVQTLGGSDRHIAVLSALVTGYQMNRALRRQASTIAVSGSENESLEPQGEGEVVTEQQAAARWGTLAAESLPNLYRRLLEAGRH
jgi:hypothetical protein